MARLPRLTPSRRPETPRLHPDIRVRPLPPVAVEVIAVLWERRSTPLFRVSARTIARQVRRNLESVRRNARLLAAEDLIRICRGPAGGYYLTLSGHILAAAYFGGEALRFRDPTGKILAEVGDGARGPRGPDRASRRRPDLT